MSLAMRRAALVVSGAVIALALALALLVAKLRREDPLTALPREPAGAPVAELETWRERWNGRVLLHVVLEGRAVGRVRFVVSLPDPVPGAPVPVAVVLGGL